MRRLVLARCLQAVPTVALVVLLVFSLVHLVPGDPVELLLGEAAVPADIEQMRARLGLDRPLLEQLARRVGDLLRGDLGTSIATGEPVLVVLARAVPATLELAAASLLVALAIGLPLGTCAALGRDRWPDHLARVTSLLSVSVPNFWLGPMLILLFAIQLDVLPVSGRDSLASLVLPALTLGSGLAGLLTRIVRTALTEEAEKPYVRAAIARGLGPREAILRHAARVAALPVATVVGLQLGGLLAGAIVTETVFGWPGLGRLLVQAIRLRDYPVVEGTVLLVALATVAVSLVTDLAYALLDPRIRTATEAES